MGIFNYCPIPGLLNYTFTEYPSEKVSTRYQGQLLIKGCEVIRKVNYKKKNYKPKPRYNVESQE